MIVAYSLQEMALVWSLETGATHVPGHMCVHMCVRPGLARPGGGWAASLTHFTPPARAVLSLLPGFVTRLRGVLHTVCSVRRGTEAVRGRKPGF